MSINLDSPVLSYVGAIDVTDDQTSGSTMYNVLFDSSLTTAASVLMFEYKLLPQGINNPTPDSVTLGYINTEQANFQAGISNQWQISIPANARDPNIYDPSPSLTVQVRVYAGKLGTSEIVVTDWSNALNVHNPPVTPVFFQDGNNSLVFFDTGNGESLDDLYVCLTPQEYDYSYNEINFIVAYYYADQSGNTIWNISEPTPATEGLFSGSDIMLVSVPNFGKVSSDPSLNVVYTAVYAVYNFEDASLNSFYSVSHISDTVSAPPSSYFNAPTINDVNYEIYDPSQNEVMDISWTQPGNSVINIYNVDYYVLQYQTVFDGSANDWSSVDLSNNVLEYNLNVSDSEVYPCGTTINFRVYAVNTNGGISLYSDTVSQNIFRYATAPQDLAVSNVSISGDLVNMTVSFNQVDSIGCCDDELNYIVIINGQTQTLPILSYGDASYNITYSSLDISYNGIVEVYLQTQDTNGHGPLDGASATTPYIANNLELSPIDYLVYADRSQDMYMSWTAVDESVWTLDYYEVQMFLDGSLNFSYDVSYNTSYTFDASNYSCGDTLVFYVVAHMYNGPTTYEITSNESSINMFRYSVAPQNLRIENVVVNNNNTVSMDVLFVGVPNDYSDIGCGDGLQYIVVINGIDQNFTPSYGDASYNVTYTISSTATYGTVEVYLQTQDTNSPFAARNGASAETPYIASNITLDSIYYYVYEDNSQYMDVTWNAVIQAGGWSLSSYDVQVDVDGSLNTFNTGTSTILPYNSSGNSCGQLLTFQVIAHMVNVDGTTYDIESNTQSINYFSYPGAPTGVANWAVTDPSNNLMDINATFSNPSDLGCGSPQNFVIQVYDSNGDAIPQGNTTISYNPIATRYDVNFNGLAYSAYGLIKIYLTIIDTNGAGEIPNPEIGYPAINIGEISYTTDALPVYPLPYDLSNNTLVFTVISNNPLKPVAGIVYPNVPYTPGDPLNYVQWSTLEGSTTGLIVDINEDGPNGEHIYTVTMTPAIMELSDFPAAFGIVTSNNAGINDLEISLD